MSELLEFAFSGINLIPTILLIFITIYWAIVILGIVDIDAMDIDLEVDGGVEIGGLASVLSFFNIGHMPLMVFITFFTIPLWMTTLIVNDFLGFSGYITGLVVFIPSFIVSLFIAKFLTIPIAKFYRKVRNNTEAVENIVGQVCTAKLTITSDRKSQAEIKVNGTSVLIYAMTREGQIVEKGETALIIDFVEAQSFYYVEPYNQ
ncbi:hypothetical protein [Reichenbachiella sp.]|uniref:hypothetical protein n=1 Tax=Reichenbachiella sp. TaxID=2184521 RepID=UPI003BAF90E8